MKRNRFLVLYGDQLQGLATHEALVLACRSLGFAAQELQLDCTSGVIQGAGHEMPPKYATMIAHGVCGERPPEPEAR